MKINLSNYRIFRRNLAGPYLECKRTVHHKLSYNNSFQPTSVCSKLKNIMMFYEINVDVAKHLSTCYIPKQVIVYKFVYYLLIK